MSSVNQAPPDKPRKPSSALRAYFRFSRTDLYTVVGLIVALAAGWAYYHFFVKGRPQVEKPRPAVARFTAVEGRVVLKQAGKTEWTAAALNGPLSTGDVVRTEKGAGAQITFTNKNVVVVRPDSVFLISGQSAERFVEAGKAALRVESGQVNFDVQQVTEISTPTARTTATNNTAGNIDVTEKGETGVKIYKGSAQVATRSGQTINLTSNQAVQVDSAGKAAEKLVLPEVPVLLEPPRQAEIPYTEPPKPTTKLAWKPVPGAAAYHVAMDYNVVQANLLLSAALDQKGVQDSPHEVQGLDVGKYYWRVAAVNKDGVEGAFSTVALFTVIKPETPQGGPPTLVVESLDALGNVLEVRGRTDPGNAVTVDGHPVTVEADGSFSEFIQRGGGPTIVIRATGPNGGVAEQKRTAMASN